MAGVVGRGDEQLDDWMKSLSLQGPGEGCAGCAMPAQFATATGHTPRH